MRCMHHTAIVSAALAACLSVVGAPAVKASQGAHYRLFVLHSYEAHHVCGRPQHEGFVEALKGAGFRENDNLTVQTYYMDTKRRNNTSALMAHQAEVALEQIESFAPNVLVTFDDNAFRTVALRLVDTSIPVVFCGLNGQPEAYDKTIHFMDSRRHPGHNITGVYEKLHVVDALNVHAKLFPDFGRIVFFTDVSPTGMAITTQIEIEMTQEPVPREWEVRVMKNWEEYRAGILSVSNDPRVGVIYPAALLLKGADGTTYTAPEILAWTVRHSTKPEIAMNYGFTRLGLFGGAAVDFFAMGCQAGEMTARILRGERPRDIPVEDARRYALVFNLDRAEELHISIPSDVLMAADEVIRRK